MRAVSILAGLVLAHAAFAQSWNQFRGPNGSGVAVDCKPPLKIEAAQLAWQAALPAGLSSPVLQGERVFITATENERLLTLALDRKTGRQLWRREAPKVPLERVHEAGSPAASTPLVDAKQLYVYFGSYGLICYDHEGAEQWSKPMPTPKSLYGMSCSPIAHGDSVIMVLDNDENLPGSKMSRSKIIALNKADGRLRWEAARPLRRSSWTTPMIWKHEQGTDLVVLGNDRLAGYDPDSGEQRWYADGFSRETIAVPVAGNGKIYAASSRRGGTPDATIDPDPFWKAIMQFDANGDEKLERKEMTTHFTWPFRPELPLGHPGYGMPLPRDPKQREGRLTGMFGGVDKDRDGFWTREEFVKHIGAGDRRGKPQMLAVRPGGKGNVADSHVSWELNKGIPEIPSPLFFEQRIYMVRNGGVLSAVDAEQGDIIYRERLGGSGQYSASPVLANGHLYLVSNRGTVSVVKAGAAFALVHEFELAEPSWVSPAIDADTIYFRTGSGLRAYRAD